MNFEKLQLLPVELLELNEENPRDVSHEEFNALVEDMRKDPDFFNGRGCMVNHDTSTGKFTIYAGNQRYRAARQLGYKEIPCYVDVNLDKEIQDKRAILDNFHRGKWDVDKLANFYDMDFLLSFGDKFVKEIGMPNIEDFRGNLQDTTELLEEGTAIRKNGFIIKTEVIFDNETQRKDWDSLLSCLREIFEEAETIAERLSMLAKPIAQHPPLFVRFLQMTVINETDSVFIDKLDTFIQEVGNGKN